MDYEEIRAEILKRVALLLDAPIKVLTLGELDKLWEVK